MNRFGYIWIITIFCFISCEKDAVKIPVDPLAISEIPVGFDEIVYPQGNAYTPERWALGKKLFYDPIMSADGSTSCASCHEQSLGFADNVAFSLGSADAIGTRNAPSLANVAYHPYYTREGGIPTLEMQILVPIQEHNEFNNNIVLIADTLSQIKEYVDMAADAYDQEPNAFVITRALANFERTLISGQSEYDLENNYGHIGTMSEAAIRGQALFNSDRTQCSSCHGGFNFTSYAFKNNGLYLEYPDNGRARLTNKDEDIALFKVPSLRNVAVSPPYMHDGSIATLDAVIEHYNLGGESHFNKSEKIKPLNLTAVEKADMKAFLMSLTDHHFLNNKNYSNE